MRNALLVLAAMLFAIALWFPATEQRYQFGVRWGAANVVAAAGCAGFAIAGRLTVAAAAIVHRSDHRS